MFGAWTHARPDGPKVTFTDKDFTHRDMVPNAKPPKPIELGTLNIDHLEKTDLFEAVTKAYKT